MSEFLSLLPQVVVLNGSLGGNTGNTQQLLNALYQELEGRAQISEVILKEMTSFEALFSLINQSHAFIFATGTYWDSWGSPMQRFLEAATESEGTSLWLGKPAATLVTMHSVGGKGILSRLQGVQSTFGLLVPPMCGMTYSLANHLALQHPSTSADFWSKDDLNVIASNLLSALTDRPVWKTWTVDREDPHRKWFIS